MSAFMQTPQHFALLTAGLIYYGTRQRHGNARLVLIDASTGIASGVREIEYTNECAELIWQTLVNENIRSLLARYGTRDSGAMETPFDAILVRRAMVALARMNPQDRIGMISMAIRGYEYQACESDDWNRTQAREFMVGLRVLLLQAAAPEHEDAWCVKDDPEKW